LVDACSSLNSAGFAPLPLPRGRLGGGLVLPLQALKFCSNIKPVASSVFVGLARQANRFLSRQKSGEKSAPLASVTPAKRTFSRRRPNSPSALAQTMSAFTLEKPRPLGTRKRGFWVYRFQSGFILMDCLIEKLLAANLVAQNPTPSQPLLWSNKQGHPIRLKD